MSRHVDMAEIRARARGYWFSAGTMRFFRSRVGSYGRLTDNRTRCYFVSSEQDAGPGLDGHWRARARLYSVRVMDWTTGSIDAVGPFGAYADWHAADRAAARLADARP